MIGRWPRTSWVIRWGGLGTAIVVAAVFLLSIRWRIVRGGHAHDGFSIALSRGAISFCWNPDGMPHTGSHRWWLVDLKGYNFNGYVYRPSMVWWFKREFGVHGGAPIYMPLWIPLALVSIPTALAWRRWLRAQHRASVGLCRRCDYDLAGVAAGVCPECGRVKDP